MTLTDSELGAGTVTRYWGTPITIDKLPIDDIIGPGIADVAAGPACETLDPRQVLDDPDRLVNEFLASFSALAAAQDPDDPPAINGAHLDVQVWRHGYDEPAAGYGSDFIGWCFLATSPAPAHSESGALSLADPRAGSAMTAMPGLPWGRQVMVRPVPGAHLAAPGWLTSSVVPLERGQFAVIAIAQSVR